MEIYKQLKEIAKELDEIKKETKYVKASIDETEEGNEWDINITAYNFLERVIYDTTYATYTVRSDATDALLAITDAYPGFDANFGK